MSKKKNHLNLIYFSSKTGKTDGLPLGGGFQYTGQFQNDMMNGKGTIEWLVSHHSYLYRDSGAKYEGEIQDNHLEGEGVFTWYFLYYFHTSIKGWMDANMKDSLMIISKREKENYMSTYSNLIYFNICSPNGHCTNLDIEAPFTLEGLFTQDKIGNSAVISW